ncbi:MAG: site-specific integrase [Candidatus Bathyarchaeota archaeon]|nr:site-specific integrase [Candidatus Bathyarchaeota archaeon]
MTAIKSSDEEEINYITSKSPIREKAFFTIMRQSGLSPNMIKQLKTSDIDLTTETPCKIKSNTTPTFIGEEAKRYTIQYLKSKNNKATESLLFTLHNSNKEINTKDVSRTFRRLAEEYEKTKIINCKKKLKLFDLVKFYRRNAKIYLNTLKDNTGKSDDFYRKLYEEKAQPYLETETLTIREIEINQHKKEIKELNERLERIEHVIFPKTRKIKNVFAEAKRIEKWIEKHPEEAKAEEEWYDEKVRQSEEVEKLLKKDPWHYACYIVQMHDKMEAIEYMLKSKTKN